MNPAAKKFKTYQVLMCWGEGPRYLVGHGSNSLKTARQQAQSMLTTALKKYKRGARPWVVVMKRQLIADVERIA